MQTMKPPYNAWNDLQKSLKIIDSLDDLELLSETKKVNYIYFKTKSLKWP